MTLKQTRAKEKLLNQKLLKTLLQYDPKTGQMFWVVSRQGARKKSEAGSTLRLYRLVCINGKNYKRSRLAFLYMKGKWPKDEIDHKNTNTFDDRWNNLREATPEQNKQNRKMNKKNVVEIKGVSITVYGKFRATIQRQHIGTFETKEDAARAYRVAAKQRFGKFARW